MKRLSLVVLLTGFVVLSFAAKASAAGGPIDTKQLVKQGVTSFSANGTMFYTKAALPGGGGVGVMKNCTCAGFSKHTYCSECQTCSNKCLCDSEPEMFNCESAAGLR